MLPVIRLLADLFGSETRHDVLHQLQEQFAVRGIHVREAKLYRLIDQGRCSRTLMLHIQAVIGPEHAPAFEHALRAGQTGRDERVVTALLRPLRERTGT